MTGRNFFLMPSIDSKGNRRVALWLMLAFLAQFLGSVAYILWYQ